jgi:quercetin dioxygenase-like cupin family protein
MNYDALVSHAESTGDIPPGGEQIVYGGVHINKFAIKAGTVLISHCHVYDHPSILASGEVELWTGPGELKYLIGPTEVKIAAGVKHALTALTDCVWYCVHAGAPEVE